MSTTDTDLTLREVPGPSALGGGWRRSLDLLYLFAVNDFKKTYFNTALGYAWSLARPLPRCSAIARRRCRRPQFRSPRGRR